MASPSNPYDPAQATEAVPQSNNVLGVVAFITSILGVPSCGLLNVISLPLSLIALLWKPRGFAIAGLVLSICGTGFLALIGWGIVATILGIQGEITEHDQRMRTNTEASRADTAIQNYLDMHGNLPEGVEGNKLVIEATEPDAWGTDLRYDREDDTYQIRSAGPDKEFNTEDDLTWKAGEKKVETEINIDFGEGATTDGPFMIPEDGGSLAPSPEINLPDDTAEDAPPETPMP